MKGQHETVINFCRGIFTDWIIFRFLFCGKIINFYPLYRGLCFERVDCIFQMILTGYLVTITLCSIPYFICTCNKPACSHLRFPCSPRKMDSRICEHDSKRCYADVLFRMKQRKQETSRAGYMLHIFVAVQFMNSAHRGAVVSNCTRQLGLQRYIFSQYDTYLDTSATIRYTI